MAENLEHGLALARTVAADLVVIPELRISDKGLIDVNRFEVVPVVEREP